jgi:hypothetical protein
MRRVAGPSPRPTEYGLHDESGLPEKATLGDGGGKFGNNDAWARLTVPLAASRRACSAVSPSLPLSFSLLAFLASNRISSRYVGPETHTAQVHLLTPL